MLPTRPQAAVDGWWIVHRGFEPARSRCDSQVSDRWRDPWYEETSLARALSALGGIACGPFREKIGSQRVSYHQGNALDGQTRPLLYQIDPAWSAMLRRRARSTTQVALSVVRGCANLLTVPERSHRQRKHVYDGLPSRSKPAGRLPHRPAGTTSKPSIKRPPWKAVVTNLLTVPERSHRQRKHVCDGLPSRSKPAGRLPHRPADATSKPSIKRPPWKAVVTKTADHRTCGVSNGGLGTGSASRQCGCPRLTFPAHEGLLDRFVDGRRLGV